VATQVSEFSRELSIMTQRPLIQALLTALSCWVILQLVIRFLGIQVGVIVVVVTGAMTWTTYLLRYNPRQLSSINANKAGRHWVRFVARMVKLQEAQTNDQLDGLNLKTPEDFAWFHQRLQEEVFGHEDVPEAITLELQKNALLRARSETKEDLPPLGVIHLANRLTNRLFEQPMTTSIDLRHCPDGDAAISYLFGTPGSDGALVKPVRMSPCHTIVLESIEVAGTKLQEALKELFIHGRCIDGARGGIVSFEKCVFVMTTTAVPEVLLKEESFDRDRMIDALNDKTGLPADILDCASVCAVLKPADDLVKAQVITQLMIDECQRYDLKLDYVEPEVIAREVEHFSDSSGFEYSRIRIARWISDPVHLAVQHGMDSLVLTADLVNQDQSITKPAASSTHLRQQKAVLTENLTT
jgi:hypothetical protein